MLFPAEDMVGPHDEIMASCGVSGAALSDKITIVSFIEDVVAQDLEVKRQVEIEAAAMTTEEDAYKLSIQYHSIYVAACAVRPEQVQPVISMVQHAERTSPQSSESTTDNSDGEGLDPQDNAIR